MSSVQLSIGFIVALLALMGLGIPIGVVILFLAATGIFLVSNIDLSQALATAFFSQVTSWSLTSLPLFVLMGEILGRAGVANKMFDSFAILLGRVPGGLLQVNILATTMFSALSGSSTATVATMGKLAYPRLKERSYPRALSLGSLAGAGTLGILIPPSIALILYGFTFDVSISALFLAGVAPGLMLAIFFAVYIAIVGRHLGNVETSSLHQKWNALKSLTPFLALIALVFGSIYGGFATPTEAAVIGTVGAGILAHTAGDGLSKNLILHSLRSTVLFCAAIGFILAASAALQVAMAYTGIPRSIVSLINSYDLGQFQLLLIIGAMLLILGCFIDGLSMIVLTSAVLQPIILTAGIDPLWFGIFMVILVEIGLITPPIGINLFILQKATGEDIVSIAWAALPFLFILLFSLFLFSVFPQIVLFLPKFF